MKILLLPLTALAALSLGFMQCKLWGWIPDAHTDGYKTAGEWWSGLSGLARDAAVQYATLCPTIDF